MYRPLTLLPILFFTGYFALAQNETDERALLNVEQGVTFSKDSLFKMNLRFRMQNRAGVETVSGRSLEIARIDARVRRLRLRFDGYALHPKFQYYIQLSFSKADQDLENRTIAQTIRDAVIYYHFSPSFYIGFGQAKLPGNRQRVISSGNLQFVDRSLANSLFTIDRDFGLFGYWTPAFIDGRKVTLKLALTTGEGRNASPGDEGLAYTARLEWLPFGSFSNSGDFSEGDLEFEPTPKLSLGGVLSYNQNAQKTGGQLGDELFAKRNIRSYIFDMMFKYNGWMVSTEWLARSVDNPLTFSEVGELEYLITGYGWNWQLSRMLSPKTELATRYTLIQPDKQMDAFENRTERFLIGITRYLKGHRIKLQGNVGYHWENALPSTTAAGNFWLSTFQVEFGI